MAGVLTAARPVLEAVRSRDVGGSIISVRGTRRGSRRAPDGAGVGADVSIDAFLRTHQPGAAFTALVHQVQARAAAKGYSRSLVHVLAQLFVDEGARGVEAVSRTIGPAGVAVVPDPTILQRLPPEDRTALSADLGAILLGGTARRMEGAPAT